MKYAVQAKGQVTIPKEARDDLGLKPGDEAIWIKNEGRWELWSFDALVDDLLQDPEELRKDLAKLRKAYRPKVP